MMEKINEKLDNAEKLAKSVLIICKSSTNSKVWIYTFSNPGQISRLYLKH